MKQLLSYLNKLQENRIKPGLERIQEACGRLGNPEKSLKSIHIAGTNGKGSTAAILESLLRSGGNKVGLYTSPHLKNVCERIQINRKNISEKEIVAIYKKIRKECDDIPLSYFEFLTLAAFIYFEEQKIDIAIFETGLGGRWDATNVLLPIATLLTKISLDHESFLGSNIKDVAREKCGIIKPGVPLFTASQDDAVFSVIERQAKEVGVDCHVCKIKKDLELSLDGEYQRENASLALEVAGFLLTLGYKYGKNGLKNIDWQGRLQKIEEDVLVDGAHNQNAASELVKYILSNYPNRDIVVVFDIMKDKKWQEVVHEIKKIASAWVLYRSNETRSISSKDLSNDINSEKIVIVESTEDALKRAREFGFKNPLILVTGSLYLVGKFL